MMPRYEYCLFDLFWLIGYGRAMRDQHTSCIFITSVILLATLQIDCCKVKVFLSARRFVNSVMSFSLATCQHPHLRSAHDSWHPNLLSSSHSTRSIIWLICPTRPAGGPPLVNFVVQYEAFATSRSLYSSFRLLQLHSLVPLRHTATSRREWPTREMSCYHFVNLVSIIWPSP